MSEWEAAAKAGSLARADGVLDDASAGERRWSAWVPGRIEIFGKHTDYAGGRSLLCAVEKGFVVRAAARSDALVCVTDVARGDVNTASLDHPPATTAGESWGIYVDTVVRRIAANFPDRRSGADIAFISDLPIAAGMSSSSAMIIAIFLVLARANDLHGSPDFREEVRSSDDLASYLGCVENGESFGSLRGHAGVGTFGGSEDHVAILSSRAGQLAQYSFAPVIREATHSMPASHLFVVAFSGVAAEKAAGARERYNRLSQTARHLLAEWNRITGRSDTSLARAAGSAPDSPAHLRALAAREVHDFDPQSLVRRLDQFLLESFELVPAAGAAFASGAWDALGALAERSQRAAEDWLGNQVPETVALARSARELGAIAASSFGAGFGGSVWALVPATDAADFANRWSVQYGEEHPSAAARAEFLVSRAGPGAHAW
jgi:galactokinase